MLHRSLTRRQVLSLFVDAGFLQNGRLNDVSKRWYIQPPFLSSDLTLSLGLKEPRWVNMVVLYLPPRVRV